MLHSNPGDYAWGQSGLDAIVTQVRPTWVEKVPSWLTWALNCAWKLLCSSLARPTAGNEPWVSDED